MIECQTPTELLTVLSELRRCRRDFAHFADAHCQILVGAGETAHWGRFRLWPAQHAAAADLQAHPLLIALKARQIGWTWLVLAFALWHLLLHPVATVLLFSCRD